MLGHWVLTPRKAPSDMQHKNAWARRRHQKDGVQCIVFVRPVHLFKFVLPAVRWRLMDDGGLGMYFLKRHRVPVTAAVLTPGAATK